MVIFDHPFKEFFPNFSPLIIGVLAATVAKKSIFIIAILCQKRFIALILLKENIPESKAFTFELTVLTPVKAEI
jgi:hypothetical protein